MRLQSAGSWTGWRQVASYEPTTYILRTPASCSIPAGYGLYLNGGTDTVYLATSNVTYGSLRIGGSTNNWAGIYFDNGYRGPYVMAATGSDAMGFFSELDGWRFYVQGGVPYVGASLYRIPVCAWATNAGGQACNFTRGTGAPTGGSDGETYFRTDSPYGAYHNVGGTWRQI
jgi:hypothetical protein